MKLTLTSWVPTNLKDLIETAGYHLGQVSIDDTVLVRIDYKHAPTPTAPTDKIYIEWAGIYDWDNLDPTYTINDTESAPIIYGEIFEFSTEAGRLKDIRILGCCNNVVFYLTII